MKRGTTTTIIAERVANQMSYPGDVVRRPDLIALAEIEHVARLREHMYREHMVAAPGPVQIEWVLRVSALCYRYPADATVEERALIERAVQGAPFAGASLMVVKPVPPWLSE